VEVTAKVEQDPRNDNLQLVSQSMKPLEVQVAAANGNGTSRPVAAVRPLVLRLDSERHSVEELHTIHGIIAAHPGATPVHISVRRGNGKLVHIVTPIHISSDGSVMDELKPWIN
jgi:hypothetical protein